MLSSLFGGRYILVALQNQTAASKLLLYHLSASYGHLIRWQIVFGQSLNVSNVCTRPRKSKNFWLRDGHDKFEHPLLQTSFILGNNPASLSKPEIINKILLYVQILLSTMEYMHTCNDSDCINKWVNTLENIISYVVT